MELGKVAFYDRTLSEYLLFFNLTIEELKNYDKIIDCPAGASSFAAEVNDDYSINSKKKLSAAIYYLIKVWNISNEKEKIFLML